MKIKREHTIKDTYRVSSIRGQFDFDKEKSVSEWDVDIDMPDDWQIGVIVGSSGGGKTTIGKEYFGEKNYFTGYEWTHDSVVDDFPEHLDIKEITTALSSVGFSSPPNWLQPFHTLSNGQKFRVEMARVLFDERELVVVDEFTSVVDRTVAQVGSHAIQKYIRKNVKNKKIVLLSCHYDVLDWLQPDWVYDVNTRKTTRGCLWRRPDINVEFFKLDSQHRKQYWDVFVHHHYLNSDLAPAAQCFVAYVNGSLAGFTSYVHSFGKKYKRAHRTVVLPDFQGLGLGALMGEFMGEYIWNKHKTLMTSVTSHPAMIHYRAKSNKWVMKELGHSTGVQKYSTTGAIESNRTILRITGSFVYVGDRGFQFLKGWKDG